MTTSELRPHYIYNPKAGGYTREPTFLQFRNGEEAQARASELAVECPSIPVPVYVLTEVFTCVVEQEVITYP